MRIILARLKLEKGDTVFLTEVANGAVTLSPYDADFEAQMDARFKRRVARMNRT